jgi:ATP-dependent Lhr-like helicase
VIQVSSPGSVARAVQRVGRARHQVGGTPKGKFIAKHREEILEIATIVAELRAGEIETTRIPRNALDVLAQQVVGAVATADQRAAALFALFRRAYTYRDLPLEAFASVLQMLCGQYPSEDFIELRPRIAWDHDTDLLCARPGTRMLASVNTGKIT